MHTQKVAITIPKELVTMMDYRALAAKEKDIAIWYWIGDHKTYEQLLE